MYLPYGVFITEVDNTTVSVFIGVTETMQLCQCDRALGRVHVVSRDVKCCQER